MTVNEDIYTSIYICTCIHIINTDLSICRPVDLVLLSITKIRLGLGLD